MDGNLTVATATVRSGDQRTKGNLEDQTFIKKRTMDQEQVYMYRIAFRSLSSRGFSLGHLDSTAHSSTFGTI